MHDKACVSDCTQECICHIQAGLFVDYVLFFFFLPGHGIGLDRWILIAFVETEME